MGLLDLFQKKSHIKVGDSIRFGKYYFANEKDIQPIEWIVLDSDETGLLLISKYCLDTVHYVAQPWPSDVWTACIWENSHLRNWLNQTFYDLAFDGKEKSRILVQEIVTDETLDPALHQNKVFLLSESQAADLLTDAEIRKGIATPYAVQRGAFVDGEKKTTWWWVLPHIEITGGQPPRKDYPNVVLHHGEVAYHSRLVGSPGSFGTAVRPVIKIKK